jgi:putative resolvase
LAVSGVAQVGSGVDGKRWRLRRVLSVPGVTMRVVEHRDRVARFGVEDLEAALAVSGRGIVVLDPDEEVTSDLVRDVIEVLASMCARLYGAWAAKSRVARVVAGASGGDPW